MILKEIQQFYYSDFWKYKYYKRLSEEGINISTYNDIISLNDKLIGEIRFKTYKDVTTSNGLSYGKIIELNENLDTWEKDIEHFLNLIMHEFGHILYELKLFELVVHLNKLVFLKNTPSPIGLETDSDYKYFTDFNELRLRIIPFVYMQYINKWTSKLTYNKVCKYDDIFDIYNKDLIIYWIDNIL